MNNNALVHMFPRIQNEALKEWIWVRIRGAVLAKKGASKLTFHRDMLLEENQSTVCKNTDEGP